MTNLPELRKILSDAPDGATHIDEVEFEHFYYKSNGYGFLDCEHDAPVCSDDIIRIRSLADIRTIVEQAEENQALKAKVAKLEAYLDNVKTLSIYVAFHDSAQSVSLKQAREWLETFKLEQQAKGLEEMLDVTDTWSVMNTYAITVDDIYEQMQELRKQAKQLKGGAE